MLKRARRAALSQSTSANSPRTGNGAGALLALVQFLLTLDGETSVNTEASWDTEIRARLKAFDEGKVEASPYEALRQNMMLRFCR
ncbi:MAG: hypothetical protein EBR81_06745 [Proteobacteria bacterium]|nr:hypothetical protein [Pseudomonadota bacterium]